MNFICLFQLLLKKFLQSTILPNEIGGIQISKAADFERCLIRQFLLAWNNFLINRELLISWIHHPMRGPLLLAWLQIIDNLHIILTFRAVHLSSDKLAGGGSILISRLLHFHHLFLNSGTISHLLSSNIV